MNLIRTTWEDGSYRKDEYNARNLLISSKYYTQDEEGEWEVKNVDEEFIAVYSTRERAEKALEKFKTQPRFAGKEQ